ncbi:maoA [Scenedesmus sp. PABB004]|nr:maoA [Scenedesmus sp. PABB004]
MASPLAADPTRGGGAPRCAAAARRGAAARRPLAAGGARHRPCAAAGPAPPRALPAEADAVVVGGGLAGLNAAAVLRRAGLRPLVLEASDGVGGRARSDVVEGFTLDRGFQIFLTGYPEAAATLDYEALQLRPFYAGARVRFGGAWHTVADPLRHFWDGVASLGNPIGSVADKVNVGLFRIKSLLGPLDAIFERPETTTLERLQARGAAGAGPPARGPRRAARAACRAAPTRAARRVRVRVRARQAEGFSPAMVDRFFRPFLGGIFFNTQLSTSSRLFEFVMRMLATGSNCLPAAGIGAMAGQLAAGLPDDSVLTGAAPAAARRRRGVGRARAAGAARVAPPTTRAPARRAGAKVQRVTAAAGGRPACVELASGETVAAAHGVVVAVEGPEAWRLLGEAMDVRGGAGGCSAPPPRRRCAARAPPRRQRRRPPPAAAAAQVAPSKSEPGVGTACVYFRAPAPPAPDPILYLNGTGEGLVNNCCFPSTVAPSYAPPGQTLVSASVIGTQPQLSDEQLVAAVRRELAEWFGGAAVDSWSHLRTYRIPYAQPNQAPPTNFTRPVALGGGLFVCGDHRDSATFDAALRSGRRAAEALIAAAGTRGAGGAAPALAAAAAARAGSA